VTILNWILEHWELTLFVVTFALSLIFKSKEDLKSLAYQLMLEAEKLAKEELLAGGPEKMEFVLTQLVQLLPGRVKAILTVIALLFGKSLEELLTWLAQRWYQVMKEYLERDATRLIFSTPESAGMA